MKIGVVGWGFVGKAVEAGFQKPGNEIIVADPKIGYTVEDMVRDHKDFGVVFVCTPTPMLEGGFVDIRITENVLQVLSELNDTIIALKSTVTPNHVSRWEALYDNFVYNPEFLTEANAVNDFLNPPMHVFGGNKDACNELQFIYQEHSNCSWAPAHFMTASEASFVKYTINSFLSLKVAFFNQLNDLIKSSEANYDTIIEAIKNDERIGTTHMSVPGHDGRRGFGSACFAKDVPAIIRFSQSLNKDLTILKEAWNYNVDVRNSYKEPLPREKEQHITFNKIW